MTTMEIVTWRETTWSTTDLVGFEVEATEGGIGKVDERTRDVQMHGFLVIDTGAWIFGKKVMLPAGVVQSVSVDEETIYVDRTKNEIKNGPEFDDERFHDEPYRNAIGSYYAGRSTARTDAPL